MKVFGLTISTYQMFQNQWLICLQDEDTVYKHVSNNGCTMHTIMKAVVLVNWYKFKKVMAYINENM